MLYEFSQIGLQELIQGQVVVVLSENDDRNNINCNAIK